MSGANDKRKRITGLAAIALRDAVAGDMQAAMNTVKQISDQTGGGGLEYAMRAWCDSLIIPMRHATGTPDNAVIRPAWVDADSGHVDFNADDVAAETRWAGQMISARAAMDKDNWNALMAALPRDGFVIGDYICALLGMVAGTLQALKTAGAA